MPSKKIKVPDFYYQEMTAAGYRQIEDQIEALKKQRPEKIARLKAARALGDLSENTEYSTAKRDLRHLESRLRYLSKQLTYAKIITPQDTGKVGMGSTVELQYDDDDETETYTLVGRQEADILQGKLAFDSPLGKAITRLSAGDSALVAAPQGEYQVKVVSVRANQDEVG